MPSSMRVRGIGRRSARPPYNSLWATFPAAAATELVEGIGTSAMSANLPHQRLSTFRRSSPFCFPSRPRRPSFAPVKLSTLIGTGAVVAGAVAARDLTQKKHAILRNFPVLGHARYWLETIGPELRQYIVTSNEEERPFSRDQRTWIYASAKSQNNYFGFGTDVDVEHVQGHAYIKHRTFDHTLPDANDPLSTLPS